MILALTLILAAAQQTPPQAEAATKVCRTRPVTGNRARVDRVCRTKAEWQAIDNESRRVSGQIVDQQRARAIGN